MEKAPITSQTHQAVRESHEHPVALESDETYRISVQLNDAGDFHLEASVHFGYKDEQPICVPSPFVESVTVTDSTYIDFTLKSGLMRSGGYGEVTAGDVAYSYDSMAESEWKGDYVAYEQVDVKDKYSGAIVLNQPFLHGPENQIDAIRLKSGYP